jgi:predicted transposase/invertase (TIGR01784 family)
LALEEGFAEGMEKGMEKERVKAEAEKRESAIKMLQNGFDIKLIADILGLPTEELKKLK